MSGADNRSGRTPDGAAILHAEFDWDVIAPSMAVVQTVAIAAEREPTELAPLIETLDPDALDELFAHSTDPESTVSLSFHLGEYVVSVTGRGDVSVQSASDGS